MSLSKLDLNLSVSHAWAYSTVISIAIFFYVNAGYYQIYPEAFSWLNTANLYLLGFLVISFGIQEFSKAVVGQIIKKNIKPLVVKVINLLARFLHLFLMYVIAADFFLLN